MTQARARRANIATVLISLAVLATACSDSPTTSSPAGPPSTGSASTDPATTARYSTAPEMSASSTAGGSASLPESTTASSQETSSASSGVPARLYQVLSVADGDTITVDLDGTRERVRLIGIDAPEVSGTGECFGVEASSYAKGILTGSSVGLVADQTQDDRDRYGRLLRYVMLADGTDFGAHLIQQGYAHEYTYDRPYQRQAAYRAAESAAHSADRGLWSPAMCAAATVPGIATLESATSKVPPPAGAVDTATATDVGAAPGCDIKGNISSKGEKIYHQPGDSSYADTVITTSKGERYFCSVAEAVAAGWRAAKN